jgi:hypothetical protein
MGFLVKLKRVEELLAAGQLEEVESLLLSAQLLLNQRKAVMMSVLQLGSGQEEVVQRQELRQGCYIYCSQYHN